MHPVVNKDVLVIVPTHSRDHTFSYTIDSILNQSYKNFNLAIIGDGVTEEYKKNIQKIVDSDDRVFFYDNKKTKLTGKTGEVHRNKPIEDFNPKYITYCGDDDLLIPNHIEKMLEEIQGYDFVNPVPLPYKHWFVSIVNAVVELVKNIIEFVVLLYIPLVPSLNKIDGLVTDENVGSIDKVV
jgi:glycosyltransferase involved in cell wall biosynthesis